MTIQIRKAKRSATKLRLLLTGPSNSGKTWGALQLAKGIGGRVVVIDTEEGSSDLYDHLLDFDVIDLRPPFSPERYIEAVNVAIGQGYDIIIIDSITHCWNGEGGVLEILEHVAQSQFRGNTWAAWNVMTPRWRKFVDKIIHSPVHMICTGRAKTETVQSEGAGGKKKVEKLGMKLEARDGLEYEFTCVLDLIHNGHYATVSKDRTGLFSGDPKPLSPETGKRIADWLAGGHELKPVDVPTTPEPVPKFSESFRKASVKIEAADTVEELDALRKLIDKSHDAGRITATERELLVTDVMTKAELLIVNA